MADATALFDWLRLKGIDGAKVIVFGESLGTGIAVQVAANRSVGALVLDSPYSSIEDVAADKFPWLPIRGMVWDRERSPWRISQM